MSQRHKAVTVKLPSELYEKAADFTALTGVTFKDLVSEALSKELQSQISKREPGGIQEALDGMRTYRQRTTAA